MAFHTGPALPLYLGDISHSPTSHRLCFLIYQNEGESLSPRVIAKIKYRKHSVWSSSPCSFSYHEDIEFLYQGKIKLHLSWSRGSSHPIVSHQIADRQQMWSDGTRGRRQGENTGQRAQRETSSPMLPLVGSRPLAGPQLPPGEAQEGD